MKVKKSEFLSILEKVKSGTASGILMESMSYFFFSGTDVVSYNDIISVKYPFKTDFSLFISALDSIKLLQKMDSEYVSLNEKNGSLVIYNEKTKAELSGISDDEILSRISAVSKSLENAKWNKLPVNFCQSILLCSYSVSKQESDGTLTCVCVNGNDCISSDNDRISNAKLDSSVPRMFIKASEIKNLVNIKPIEFFESKSWIHFRNGEKCVFSIKKIIGEFPDFLQFFDLEGEEFNLPKEAITGIDIALLFANKSDPMVRVKITKSKMFITVNSEGKKVVHRSSLTYTGKDITFNINPSFLKQMMEYNTSLIISDKKISLNTDDGFQMITALYNE